MSSVSGPSERYARHAGFLHGVDRGNLVAHQADGFGFRADEDEAGAFHLLGEVGVLGQEAVAGWIATAPVISAAEMMAGMFR